jgi:ParB/RepB/Spo0J family partition protein
MCFEASTLEGSGSMNRTRREPEAKRGSEGAALARALLVPIDQIVHDPSQPRRDQESDDGIERFHTLAASIKQFGLLQPIIARRDGLTADGRVRYRVISGERRLNAARMVNLDSVPLVVREDEPKAIPLIQLIENIHRQDLSPVDEGRAFQRYMDAHQLSANALATTLKLSPKYVRDKIRVARDPIIAQALERGLITYAVARDIMYLSQHERGPLLDHLEHGHPLTTADLLALRSTDAHVMPLAVVPSVDDDPLLAYRQQEMRSPTGYVPAAGGASDDADLDGEADALEYESTVDDFAGADPAPALWQGWSPTDEEEEMQEPLDVLDALTAALEPVAEPPSADDLVAGFSVDAMLANHHAVQRSVFGAPAETQMRQLLAVDDTPRMPSVNGGSEADGGDLVGGAAPRTDPAPASRTDPRADGPHRPRNLALGRLRHGQAPEAVRAAPVVPKASERIDLLVRELPDEDLIALCRIIREALDNTLTLRDVAKCCSDHAAQRGVDHP